jgi:hypothetical protein
MFGKHRKTALVEPSGEDRRRRERKDFWIVMSVIILTVGAFIIVGVFAVIGK